MEFPYGNTNRHQHHHRHDESEDLDYPPPPPQPQPPPPPYYGGQHENYDQYPPPQPQVTHVYHSSHAGGGNDQFPPPPPPHFGPNHFPPQQDFNKYPRPPSPTHDFNSYSSHSSYPPTQGFDNYSDSSSYPPPAPSQTTVQHVSHEGGESDGPHLLRPHMPSFIHNYTHHQGSQPPNEKPAVRIYTKARSDYSLTVRNGKVILAPSDPSDPFQHWIKDERYSTKVKDEQGYPSFGLINKGSGEAIKHSIGATHPVQLIPYNPDVLDESVLWTLSKDLGDGFRTIRMVNNIRLNVDAFNGDKNHGGVHDGTIIVLWEWKKGDNQRWTLVPYWMLCAGYLMEFPCLNAILCLHV